jgi:hypothetical protein
MLLEILNQSKEIYVCLYVILPLAAYSQGFPELVKPYAEQINILVRKIVQIPGGLDESSLLYVGHWILALITSCDGVLSGENLQGIILYM